MSSYRESQVDENIHGIKFSNLAQIKQIHEIKYLQILIFEFKL